MCGTDLEVHRQQYITVDVKIKLKIVYTHDRSFNFQNVSLYVKKLKKIIPEWVSVKVSSEGT